MSERSAGCEAGKSPCPALLASARREAQLRQILDLVPDYIFANDEDGNVLLANDACARAYGVSRETMEHSNIVDLDPDREQAERLLALDREVIAAGKPFQVPQMEVVDAGGRRRVVDIRMFPYVEQDTGKSAVCGVALDVTELKRQERAIREKERIDRELEIARGIQRALLPEATPRVAGFEICGWNEPADRTGGDYYDWLALPDGRVLVAIADVTGHGVGPAILASACRAYLRSCSQMEPTLERVMTRVNQLLSSDLSDGRFVTAAVGILDPRMSRIKLYSAGHAPILFYRAQQRRFHQLPANDVPLGLMALSDVDPVSAHEITFDPGDMLVLVTDGYFEWANAREQAFGIERLMSTLEAHVDKPPQQSIAALNDAVRAFTAGTPQPDDLTALIVKCLALE